MIKIKSFYVSYIIDQPEWLLENINLTVKENSCIGLIGSNGSGKTTFAHAIIGLIPELINGNVKGYIYLNNQNLSDQSLDQRLKNISYSFQDVESQILFGNVSDIIGLNESNADQDLVLKITDILEIDNLLERSPEELSSGEAQRVALAATFRKNPKLIIYDEATSALDPLIKKQFINLISFLKSQKKSIMLLGQRSEILFPFVDEMLQISKNSITRIDHKIGSLESNEQKSNTTFWENTRFTNDSSFKKLHIKKLEFKKGGTFNFSAKINDLIINKGENIAILGKNGAGKTTFFNLLNGHIKHNEFSFLINDKLKSNYKDLNKLIRTVYHSPTNQIIGSTIEEELFWLKEEFRNKIYEEIPFLSAHKDPLDLSFGQQRFLCLLSAFFSSNPILLIDEPEYGIDSMNLNYINTYLRLNSIEKSKLILFSTHDLKFAFDHADKCLLLDNGEIVSEFVPNLSFKGFEEWFFKNVTKNVRR